MPLVRGAAPADQIGATRAQITGVESAINTGAAHLRQLHPFLRSGQRRRHQPGPAGPCRSDPGGSLSLQAAAQHSQSVLRRDALLSYTGAANNPPVTPTGSGDPAIPLRVSPDRHRRHQRGRRRLPDQPAAAGQQRGHPGRPGGEPSRRRQSRGSPAGSPDHGCVRASPAGPPPGPTEPAGDRGRERWPPGPQRPMPRQRPRLRRPPAKPPNGLPNPTSRACRSTTALVRTVQNEVAPAQPAPAPAQPSPAPSLLAPARSPGASGGSVSGGVWLQLRTVRISRERLPAENTGNGFYGAYQFSQQTWNGLGLSGLP